MRGTSIAVSLALALVAGCKPEPLPRLAQLPAFSLVDQRGEPFESASLSGRVWIANFIFTACPDICPLLTDQLRDVRARLKADGVDVRYVSFSVDPRNDTPEVLAAYSRGRGASHPDWHFLTGTIAAVEATVKGGFKQAMDPMPDEPTNIMHGSHFVLVDGAGHIRGYYRTREEGLSDLVRDAARLARGGAGAGG